MSPTRKRCIQPNFYNFQRRIQRHHPLADGNHIGVIVLTPKPGTLGIPTQGATNLLNPVRNDCFAIPGSTQDNTALTLTASDGFGGWSAEKGIIDRLSAIGAKIAHLMAELLEQGFDLFFVLKAGVVRADRDFHRTDTDDERDTSSLAVLGNSFFRAALNSFDRRGLADELCAVGLEVSLDRADAAQTDRNPLLILEQAVVRQRLADFHDLDVLIFHLPQLAFSQWHDRGLFGLHMLLVVLRFASTEKNLWRKAKLNRRNRVSFAVVIETFI